MTLVREGGGGGFAPDEPMQPWQRGVVPESARLPDWCMVADPGHGHAVRRGRHADGPGTGVVYGGTSVAAFSAGYIAGLLSSLPGHHPDSCSSSCTKTTRRPSMT